MTLPWVSRATCDYWRQAAISAETRAGDLLTQLAAERDRYERLVEKLAEMQRAGFTAREPVRYTPVLPDLSPPILDAIMARSPGLNSEVARGMVAWAVEAKAKGMADEAIESAIWNGEGA